ncbi:MAG: HAMP domain-containing sensor histidine kinase [Gemmataceae bacterium]
MPSIRRSLIGYFLLLLGLALAAVGGLVDTFARETMQARETAERLATEQEFARRKQDALHQFDELLLQRADSLGRELRTQLRLIDRRDRDPAEAAQFQRFHAGLGAIGGGAPMHRWFANSWSFSRSRANEQIRRYFAEPEDHGSFQLQFPFPVPPILGADASAALPPIDYSPLIRQPDFKSRCENVLVGDTPYRRGVLKSNILPLRGFGLPPGGFPRPYVQAAAVGWAGHEAVILALDPLPFVYIQVARPRAGLDEKLDQLDQERGDRLASLAEEVLADRATLRLRLLLIFGLTFVALAAGGWVVVGRGLTPVGRLTDAVANVSEKDFRLPVEKEELSVELVPIHARLTHTLEALRRAFEREKQAVADISHELRTPLAGLLATIDVSLRKPRSADQYRDTLGECRDIGKQLNRLVERILTLARMDAGQDRHRPEPTDVADLAGGCATVVRPLAEAHGLTLTTDLTPGLTADTDPDMLREVVMNLLSNAVEYTEAGGRIDLSVRADGGRAVVAVRDTGIGMTPEVAGKVFERFYRADPSRHATGVHAGLGLAIVKEYVDRLGGTVTVASRPGQGSTFTVTLPAVTARLPEPAGV